MTQYWAMDVGGSHLACALVAGSAVVARETIPVPDARSLVVLLPHVEAAFARLGGAPAGLAVAFPGLVDAAGEKVLATPRDKYADAVGFDFPGWARSRLGVDLCLELDGRMALLGERHAGALVGIDDAVMIMLGTGIGTAALMAGRAVRGAHNQAGALGGHMSLSAAGRPCICGGVGCIETEASSWALAGLAAETPGFAGSALSAEPRLDFETLFRVARQRDPAAMRLRDYCVSIWSVAVLNMVHAYDPCVVVMAGGVMAAGDDILEPVRTHLAAHAWCQAGPPEVRAGMLGADAALLGAEPVFAGALQ